VSVLLAAALLAACDAPEASDATGTGLLAPCHVPGLEAESLCGTVTVFEDRAAGAGRTIDLRVLVIPAISPYPRPDPLFFLAGGPGQAASEVASGILPALTQVQRRRDLVFVDQRGTGDSNGLRCPQDEGLSLRQMLELDPVAETVRCREALAEEADLTRYTTDLAAADLEDVRTALGYGPINLYGVSYGTRAAMEFARRYPGSVRAMILDGVAPPQMPVGLHFAQDGQAALDALFRDCAAAADCAAAFPELSAHFDALMERLSGEEPVEVTITHPRTGNEETIPMDAELLASGVQGMLYAPSLSSLTPLTLEAAHAGDFTPFVAQTLGFSEGTGGSIYDGMRSSVMCAEDLPRYPAETSRFTEGTALSDAALRGLQESCDEWIEIPMPEGTGEPLSSDVPTLLLSGALDPVTPPRWGDLAAETLSSSLHLVAPGAGHNVGPSGCMPRVMADFVEAGTVEGLDAGCVENITRPPFFIDFAGPTQ